MKLLLLLSCILPLLTTTVTIEGKYSLVHGSYVPADVTCIVKGNQVTTIFNDDKTTIVETFSRKQTIQHMDLTWFKVDNQPAYFYFSKSAFGTYYPESKETFLYKTSR